MTDDLKLPAAKQTEIVKACKHLLELARLGCIFNCSAMFAASNSFARTSNSPALTMAFPAVLPASIPAAFASATFPSTVVLYASSSNFDAFASSLAIFIVAQVEITTTAAATAATDKNNSKMLFQESRDSPHINLTFLEKIEISVISASCVILICLGALSFCRVLRNLMRSE